MVASSEESSSARDQPASTKSSLFSTRSGRQFSVFLAGAAFVSLSILTTRRAIRRRHVIPQYYQQSNAPPQENINLRTEAFAALQIATLNVMSFAVLATGGSLWAFDISTLGELRQKLRRLKEEKQGKRSFEANDDGRSDAAVEKEFGELLAPTLARRKQREKKTDAEPSR